MPLSQRQPIILKYAELLEQNRDRLIDLLIAETGKPIDNAEYDFGMLTTCLRFFCEEAARVRQEVIPDPDGRFLHYTLRQPLGVVVGYLAWNFPLLNLGYKLGPVLAAGCTAVIKPSRLTPLATLAVRRSLDRCRTAARGGERDHGNGLRSHRPAPGKPDPRHVHHDRFDGRGRRRHEIGLHQRQAFLRGTWRQRARDRVRRRRRRGCCSEHRGP